MSFYDFVVSGWDPCVNVVLLEDCAAVLGQSKLTFLFSIQSWARDNTAAKTWLCFQVEKLLIIALCLYSLWLVDLDIQGLHFFVIFLVSEATLLCCIFIVAKLNNCRLPNSYFMILFILLGRVLNLYPGMDHENFRDTSSSMWFLDNLVNLIIFIVDFRIRESTMQSNFVDFWKSACW